MPNPSRSIAPARAPLRRKEIALAWRERLRRLDQLQPLGNECDRGQERLRRCEHANLARLGNARTRFRFEAGQCPAGRQLQVGYFGVAGNQRTTLRRLLSQNTVVRQQPCCGENTCRDNADDKAARHAYCTVMFAPLISLPHLSMSLRKKASNSDADITIGTAPCFSQPSFTSGNRITLLMCWLRKSATSFGVPFGAMTPSQMVAS